MILGILLAAGQGRRIGAPKALLPFADETFHARAVRTFRQAGLDVLVVVNAAVQAALPSTVEGEGRIENGDPDQPGGMFSSVRLAVDHAIAVGCSGVVLLPVDHPLITAEDVRAVVDQLHKGTDIALPVYRGRRGHPIGISRSVMNEIAQDQTLQTLREVVHKDPTRVVEVAGSRGILVGVNTRDDLARVSDAGFR